jgi:molybdate transport system substrate-binding protein
MNRRLATAITIAVTLTASGCADAEGGSDSARLQVFAAASLTQVFPRIDDRPRYQFAGSDELTLQIREGAGADVLAAASPRYPLELFEEGLVNRPVVFATNELVLIVPEDNPADITSIHDLRHPDVKFVIAAEGVPVGDYTLQVLEKLGALDLLSHVASEEQDVKGVVSKVRLGEADAGFSYATDVDPAQDDISSIALPAEAQPTVEYMVAVIAGGPRVPAAEDFVELLLSASGRAALRRAGFGAP